MTASHCVCGACSRCYHGEPPPHPKGGSKTQIDHFSSKSVLLSKKVCCKVSLCENFQRQSCAAFTGLSIAVHAQMVGGGCPLLCLKFSIKVLYPILKRRLPIYFRSFRFNPNSWRKKTSNIINRKSTTCFLMSLRWTSYAASNAPKGERVKTQYGRLSYKSRLIWKKVYCKVSSSENCQRQPAYLTVHKWLMRMSLKRKVCA